MRVSTNYQTKNSNNHRDESTKNVRKKDHTSSKNKTQSTMGRFWKAITSPQAIKIYGIFLLLSSIVIFLSILSYYFTWENDRQIFELGEENVATNWCGSVGAKIAYFFVENLFGVFSICLPFLFFLYGCRITFGKSPLPLGHTTAATLLSMAWLSMALALPIPETSDLYFLAGAFGNFIIDFLILKTGKIATFFILVALLFIILILCYNLSTESLLHLFQKHRGDSSRESSKKKTPHTSNEDETDDDMDEKTAVAEVHNLDDLYISNHEIADEYNKNVIHFETEEKNKKIHSKSNDKEVSFDVVDTTNNPSDSKENGIDTPSPNTETNALVKSSTDTNEIAELEDFDPRKELSQYQFPSTNLLLDYASETIDNDTKMRDLHEKKENIENTLKNFGIAIKKIYATVGPTVTLYEIVPEDGVRISKIKNLEDDIALSLFALGIRIIAPIPGKGTIGIEVPNVKPQIVAMKDILNSDKFLNNKYELPIGLGKTISNEPFVVDLAKMPHLLMAGATGQGKSVGLNAIIASLLYKKHPSELKFVLVDPKKVEFTLYNIIENHYLAMLPNSDDPIITDVKKVVATLNSLCNEMDARYDLLKIAGVRNIKEYNAKFCHRQLSPANGHRFLPYIVLIIDEFGDLIMTAGREVETPIARLAQLARAIGIHLVIATQRPSVNIITGVIKANFPARIAFRVSSKVDSRTILDTGGADQLIGKGDMLISTGSDLVRIQCAFIDTPEVEQLTRFIADQQAYPEPFFLPEYDTDGPQNDDQSFDSNAIDPCFMDAATLIVETQQGSTSLIQRRMRLGYARAGRIMDQLEEFKIVGESKGSKVREVRVKTTEELRIIFQNMGLI